MVQLISTYKFYNINKIKCWTVLHLNLMKTVFKDGAHFTSALTN